MQPKAQHKLVISVVMVLIVVGIILTIFPVNKTDQEMLPAEEATEKQSVQAVAEQTTEAAAVPSELTTEAASEATIEPATQVEQQAEAETVTQQVTDATAVATNTESGNAEIEQALAEPVAEIKFVEGSDYITKFPDEQAKNPILIEFFSYMCNHCYNFEPTLIRWKKQKPESVELLRVPVAFGRSQWQLAARAYYIAEELQLVEPFSVAMFKKIHFEKKPPQLLADIEKLFATLGVSKKDFDKAANSYNIDSKLRKADFLARKYKVPGVPYFLVNYKYELGPASLESEESLFRVWNNLPQKDFEQ